MRFIVHGDKNNPKVLVENVMGKGNAGIMDTLYKGVSLRSIGNPLKNQKTQIRGKSERN